MNTHFGDNVHGDKVGGNKITGPVFGGGAQDSQFAWGNRDGAQQTRNGSAAEFAPLVEAVERILANLDRLGLPAADEEAARDAGDAVLAEAGNAQPDRTAVRRALTLLKGALAPVAIGASAAANDGAREWTAAALEHLGRLFA